jgi:hypothetical protein
MTLKKLRNEGWQCEIVEKTIPKCFIKKDLFGFIDILAIKDCEVMAVQTTSDRTGGNSGERVRKILAHDNYPKVKRLGWKICVHGWRKLKTGWECKVIEM